MLVDAASSLLSFIVGFDLGVQDDLMVAILAE